MKEFTTRLIFGILLIGLHSGYAYSQKEFNAKEFFIEAESYFLFEEYNDALPLYQRILSQEPQNYNVIYKIGVCYLKDIYQKNRSIKYLSKASEYINPKYKLNSYKEKLAPIDVLYYLGQAYRIAGSLDLAEKYYKQFKSMVDPTEYNLDVVDAEIASCKSAKKLLKSPVYNKTNNLGADINTRFAELMPILSGNGKTLVFTRKLQFYDAIFVTSLDAEGNWSPPYNLTPDFGVDGNSYTTGISYNGDEVFVYRSDNFDGNIYSSKKKDKLWQGLVKLNENVNTKYWESHASISPDGKHLYFTSNRKGGYGGLDIYKSTKNTNGDWGIAVNLGPVVNSSYNENTPFISPIDNKLYFSSLGHNGMGGYDIFVSEEFKPEKWSKPTNMGYPLNTTDDDLFFCPVATNGYTGIYAYYDQTTSYGLNDIYWVEVYNEILPRQFTLTGLVNSQDLSLLTAGNAKASLIDNKTGKIVAQIEIDSLGDFMLNAPQGSYQLLIDGKEIKPVSIPVNLDLNQQDQNVNLALITITASEINENKTLSPSYKLPELLVVGEQYIITDSIPVTITLNTEKDSELKVESYTNGTLSQTEDFHLSKSKFTYVFVPEAGENKIVFTITDSRGTINQEEVLVYYTPKTEPEQFSDKKIEAKPTTLSTLALLTSAGLQTYLLTLGDINFESKTDLYNALIANAEENNYTEDDVNNLFALLLTQRDKEEFVAELEKTKEFDNNRLGDSALTKLNIPLAIVYETKNSYSHSRTEINTGLISMIPYSGTTNSEIDYILSFIDKDLSTLTIVSAETNEETWAALNTIVENAEAANATNLASTTQALDFYHQNLLTSTEGDIKELLSEINYKEHNINNSIDLVNYLFKTAPSKNIKLSDLISALETSQNSQNININNFKESFASAASGELKLSIEEINIEGDNITDFEQILNNLLLKSKSSGYSPLEVYELILKLLGITKVDELTQSIKPGTSEQLDSLINNIDIYQFSKPVELIQYLLSQSPYYDYTNSDINNLLLRMLLEKGISSYVETDDILLSEKRIKRRRIATTIILANALLVVLLLLFWRRKKNKQSE